MRKMSIYVHVPFCLSKCDYCDFLSYSGVGGRVIEDYVGALVGEIKNGAAALRGYAADTVFFGGGTPTFIGHDGLLRILDCLRSHIFITKEAEITVEANPETVGPAALAALREAGVNRLSLGAQSFDDEVLRRVGRAHKAGDIAAACDMARQAGFDNVNLDLMFSMPGQSLAGFERTLEAALALDIAHISCYGLTIEADTPLGAAGIEIDEELDRSMYALAVKAFNGRGYEHYEISNFALKGRHCRHNMAYWTGVPYRGFGLGAHSFMDGARFHNGHDLQSYLSALPSPENLEILSESDHMSEFMILGLRLIAGINCKDFSDRFAKNIHQVYGSEIKDLVAGGLLLQQGDRLRLTPLGIDLSNIVFGAFI